jgi:hypothetical protein
MDSSFSGNSTGIQGKYNTFPEVYPASGSAPANRPDDVMSLKNPADTGPFYLVVTTFSEALGQEKSFSDMGPSAGNSSKNQYNRPLCKIYDSRDIKIYEHSS